ncbi:hypothetical protein [Sphingomonas sp. NPDC079357]|uniref:hypothetical protein n=1 Tax=Sphingomonas sp. NPDC079357 TaxID=3364518 RepID=UPI003850F4EA
MAALAAVLAAVLAGFALKQLAELRSALGRSASPSPLTATFVDAQNERLLRIENALAASRVMLDRVEGRLSERASPPKEPSPPPRQETSERVASPPSVAPPPRQAAPASTPPPLPPEPRPDDEEVTIDADELIENYRTLIAQPRKTEINRWIETAGGQGCELDEDGSFQTVARDDAPLLILVPLTDRLAVVVPSARLVLDFATSFADSLALRPALRQSFELDADGSGMLRLIEPAIAVRTERTWRIKMPGRLAGLAS